MEELKYYRDRLKEIFKLIPLVLKAFSPKNIFKLMIEQWQDMKRWEEFLNK